MWREASLSFSDAVTALNCSIVPAHPWIYGLGQRTDSGAYLSPVNAVNWLAERLGGGGQSEAVLLMVTGNSHVDFLRRVGELTGVFPAPAFTQVARLAQSAAELNTVKMQIPSKALNGLPAAVPLSVPTTRLAMNAANIAKAQAEASAGSSLLAMQAQLAAFTAQHASLLDTIISGLDDLKGKAARAWVFTASGDMPTIASEMVKNIPEPSAVYCAAILLVGESLEGLRGMIHDIDSAAGA